MCFSDVQKPEGRLQLLIFLKFFGSEWLDRDLLSLSIFSVPPRSGHGEGTLDAQTRTMQAALWTGFLSAPGLCMM